MGRESDESESIISQDFQREPSLVAAKALSSCLLGKVSKFGKSGKGQMQAVNWHAWATDSVIGDQCAWQGSIMEGGLQFPPPPLWPSDTSSVKDTF